MNFKKFIFILLTFIFSLVLFIYILIQIKVISITILSPIFNGISYIEEKIDETVNLIKDKNEIIQENKRLKKEVEILKEKIMELKYVEYENKELRKLVRFEERYKGYKKITGKVIGFSPDNWSKYIFIDLGENDGIKIGDLVIADGRLIGKVKEVGKNMSTVLLISDAKFSIPARTRRTRERVIYAGKNLKFGVLKNTRPEQDIRIDDIVETREIENYPAGIPIGVVKKVNYVEGSLFKNVIVEINLKPLKLEYVIVITGKD